MKRIKKGNYGYIEKQKKIEIMKTVLFFGASLAVFLLGLALTKSKANMLTVVAVLGCLPASKSAVNMIMFLKSTGCPSNAYEKIRPHEEGLRVLYDLVLTTYEKNYKIASLAIHGNTLCGYSDSEKCDTGAAAKHIQDMLSKNGIRDGNVKILNEISAYTQRMDGMKQLELPEDNREAEIAALVLSISL